MSTLLLGLMGPAGSGKSSVADHLCRSYGATRFSFAGPLKEIAKRTLGFSDDQVFESQANKEAIDPRYNFSPRFALQRLGTEGFRREMRPTFWIDVTFAKIRGDTYYEVPTIRQLGAIWTSAFAGLPVVDSVSLFADFVHACLEVLSCNVKGTAPPLAVLEDARFINEAEAIRCFHDHLSDVPQHGYVVKLLPPPGRETTEIGSLHPSETEWMQANADHTIAPLDRGLNLLFGLVDEVCRDLKLFPTRPAPNI